MLPFVKKILMHNEESERRFAKAVRMNFAANLERWSTKVLRARVCGKIRRNEKKKPPFWTV